MQRNFVEGLRGEEGSEQVVEKFERTGKLERAAKPVRANKRFKALMEFSLAQEFDTLDSKVRNIGRPKPERKKQRVQFALPEIK